YNVGKKSIDLSDQMAAYNNPLRKWYRKLDFELLLNTVVNSFFIYQESTGQKMCITTYRKKLIEARRRTNKSTHVQNLGITWKKRKAVRIKLEDTAPYYILFLKALTKQKPMSPKLNVQSYKYARTDTRAGIT
ncbi:unnamed protein product, partial [Heterotrigona itama]